jgi:hypothetical protein
MRFSLIWQLYACIHPEESGLGTVIRAFPRFIFPCSIIRPRVGGRSSSSQVKQRNSVSLESAMRSIQSNPWVTNRLEITDL